MLRLNRKSFGLRSFSRAKTTLSANKSRQHVRIIPTIALGIFVFATVIVWYSGIANAGNVAPTQTRWSKVSMGDLDNGCAIDLDGKGYCWGANDLGQIGNGTTSATPLSSPTPITMTGVLAGKKLLDIAVGLNHACAIADDAKMYCWGGNDSGQLGIGNTTSSNVPVAVVTTPFPAGAAILQMGAGDGHSCALVSDSKVYCWGDNTYGRLGDSTTTSRYIPTVIMYAGTVIDGKTVRQISVGYYHNCAVTTDNLGFCWGYGTSGQLGNTAIANSSVAVQVTTFATSVTVKSISAGNEHTCGIGSNNKIYCWGNNIAGQVGDNTAVNKNKPTAVAVGAMGSTYTARSVSAGGWASCAVAADSKAYCWGSNEFGQVGNNSASNALIPVAVLATGVLSGKTVSYISAGEYSTCVVDVSGYAYCAGQNTAGEFGAGTITSSSSPVNGIILSTARTAPFDENDYRFYQNANSVTPGTPLANANTAATLTSVGQAFRLRTGVVATPLITSISSGEFFTCGIAESLAYCWGNNAVGQLGNASTTSSNIPVAVSTAGVLSGKTILSVAAGNNHACAIASDGKAYCWGDNSFGQLGNSSTVASNVPVAVTAATGVLGGKTVESISVGKNHTCAVASDKKVYCWGINDAGQLGNNLTASSSAPVAVTATGVLLNKDVSQLSVGNDHACVLTADYRVYCWGYNADGELGNTSTTMSRVPVAVTTTGLPLSKFTKAITAGANHTCALAMDKTVSCWGGNWNGQVGNNSIVNTNAPVAIVTTNLPTDKTIKSVSAGGGHTCLIASDDKSYCWGDNTSGQLGDGGVVTSQIPKATNATGVLAGVVLSKIEAGASHTCGLSNSGVVYCWGLNDKGQLSDATNANALTPVKTITKGYMNSPIIPASANTYKLQFAARSAATCSAQTTGYADVTSSTAIAYNVNAAVTDRTAIATTVNDPIAAASTTPQSYVSSNATPVTERQAVATKTQSLWDFSLKDNGASPATTYCLRVAYNSGTAMESQVYFPEIKTFNGTLALDFVNTTTSNSVVSNPTFSFGATTVKTTTQQTTGTFGSTTAALMVSNSLTNAWSVSLAPTAGVSALWNRSDNAAKYDFNDTATTDSDADGYAGKLSVGAMTTNTNVNGSCGAATVGSASAFSSSASSIVLATAPTNPSSLSCSHILYGASLTQDIPASQPAGTYTISMTATVVSL